LGIRFWKASCLFFTSLLATISSADTLPKHATGIHENLVEVTLDEQRTQSGVLSIKNTTQNHRYLAVLIPGYPAVFRPKIEDGVLVHSKLKGNFLIRARRHLLNDKIMSLLVDCHSQSGPICELEYQASHQREKDINALIDRVIELNPSIEKVWLIGTSMGTMSSAFVPKHNTKRYSGVIHTATLTATKNHYPQLRGFNYRALSETQFFIHHIDDPCLLTKYSRIKNIAELNKIPLITVFGGRGFKGNACNAFTQHGFRGMEVKVMREIQNIIERGQPSTFEIR